MNACSGISPETVILPGFLFITGKGDFIHYSFIFFTHIL